MYKLSGNKIKCLDCTHTKQRATATRMKNATLAPTTANAAALEKPAK